MIPMRNEELFSNQASAYAQFRPTYPPALFKYLASLAPDQNIAWDCATGSGQSAIGLASFFSNVIATDASPNQIAEASRHDNVSYVLSRAEQVALVGNSLSLITVSQALHWFELEPFYQEVRRLLRPGGILAVWCYAMIEITPEIDRVFKQLMLDVTGPYWSPRRRLVNDHYRSIPFPFPEINPPEFSIDENWNLAHMEGYIESWSSTQKYKEVKGSHPLDVVRQDLAAAWGDPQKIYPVRWPLYFRIGRLLP